MDGGNEDRRIFVKRVGELASAAHYSAAAVACLLGIGTRQLQRKFQHYLSCSPQAWLNQIRIRDAEQLLIAGASVKQTAFQLGFKQVSHFCRHFKFENGITASKFAQSRTVNGDCRL